MLIMHPLRWSCVSFFICCIIINLHLNVEQTLYTWYKSHLVMMYYSVYVLLDSVCFYLKDFYFHIHKNIGP